MIYKCLFCNNNVVPYDGNDKNLFKVFCCFCCVTFPNKNVVFLFYEDSLTYIKIYANNSIIATVDVSDGRFYYKPYTNRNNSLQIELEFENLSKFINDDILYIENIHLS